MLGLVGLAFAACGNEDEAENALAQGNGAVSIKIVSPTANSRAVTSDSPDGTIKVTGPATVSLTATFDGEEKIKTIDLARGETEAKFWNVTNPTLVTVSMNDGTKVYTTSINDVTMQVTESIPAYGETKDFTYNNRTGTPTLEDITNGDNTGAKDGDTDKTFFMYEATVDLKIPVARLEVSNIKHKKEVESVKCEYATLTIDGVYMDNIRPTGTGDLTDYKFLVTMGEQLPELTLSCLMLSQQKEMQIILWIMIYLGRQRMKMAKPKCLLITSMLRKQEMILL